MREITLEELLAAGCHFGHQITRSNSKARDFIFETRNNICIIDLAKTKETLEAAGRFISSLGENDKSLIIVGTKNQAREIVNEAVKKVSENDDSGNLYYITSRWVGGFLTNLNEVKKNFKRLAELDSFLDDDEAKTKYTKKEISLFQKEQHKLNELYRGIKNLSRIPDSLFIIDTHLEDLAVREARKTGVKTVGIVDTNADPYLIDYPIAANDDAVGSIKLIVDYIIDAWLEGRQKYKLNAKKNEELRKKEEEKEMKGKKKAEKTQEVKEPEKKKEKTEKSKAKVKTQS